MKMTGEEVIAAPRQLVWDALNDPEILKQCITGCEEVKKKSDKEFDARVTAKVGPVKATFTGNVKLSKLNPPRSYVISGEGKGGVAGFAKGGATVRLSDTGDHATKLAYDVDAQVGGKLAQIGSRLIDSTAKKMAADFFRKFNKTVSQMAERTEMAPKTAAKKAAKKTTKTAASKKTTATRTASKTATKAAFATRPAATKTSKTVSKAAAKSTAATKSTTKRASKTAGRTTVTAKAAASKTSAKAIKAASKTLSSARKATASAAKSTASAASGAAKQAASTAQSAAGSAASSASQAANTAKQAATNNIPPQAKAMSGMWFWVMLAAAAGLVVIWATGK
jgi:carbon monoxide dehydrogenase subunit G